jgi:translation initiation factor 3 subunit A
MENLNTDKLMIIQVEQLEKEKKDHNERLRIIAKRIDHLERAFRKEERPLLAKDYKEQQANDRETFEAIQYARIEASKVAHQQDLETKKRLSRMMADYRSRKEALVAKKQEEHSRKQEAAQRKIDEEKNKRRKAIWSEREEKRRREEEEEKKRREEEEELARLEAGMYNYFLMPRPGIVNERYNNRTSGRGTTTARGRGSRSRRRGSQSTQGRRRSYRHAKTTRSGTCRRRRGSTQTS